MATTQPQGKRSKSTTNSSRKSATDRGKANGKASEQPARVENDALVTFYQQMVETRLFEDAAQRGFRTGKIGGYLHVYSGQEAVAIGFLNEYREGDRVITAYRDHAHALLLGSDPKAVMAELYGKGTGLVKGKGGSMHLFDVANGFMGGYGIVGGHIPLGVGMAYSLAYQETGGIVQLFLGDGAIHNGAFHEAANLSGLWGREGLNPTLFIIENNQYGMGTSVERSTAMTDLGSKFDSYGIEHEKVDGMDLEAVLDCAHRAVKRVRERDPIGLLEQVILDRKGADEDHLKAIRDEAKARADEAVKFAEESPEPDLTELTTDVYAGEMHVPAAGLGAGE